MATGLVWDDTSETFELPLRAGLTPERVRSGLHASVSLEEYLVRFCRRGRPTRLPMIPSRPPVPLLTTFAGCFTQGRLCMLAQQCFRTFEEAAVASAKLAFISLDRDGLRKCW